MNPIIITNSDCRRHRPGIGHPESADRIRAALAGVPPELTILEAPPASQDDLALIHDPVYIASVRDRSEAGMIVHTDPDTVLSPGTWPAALGAVGAMRLAVETVMRGENVRTFCIVRPPGHHAGTANTKGFCFFNTIAIGARLLMSEYGLKRIAVIDWDAHHGNGTEEAFYEDDRVLYISLHQYPLFPGTGRRNRRGKGAGEGFNLNIPIGPGATDLDVTEAVDKEVAPLVTSYQPEIIMVSAGFDGHVDERLAAWMLTEQAYAAMTRRVVEWADRFAHGRVISLLEGGYHLPTLSACVRAHLHALSL